MGSVTWSDVWEQILNSYHNDSKLQQICANLQKDPQLHAKYSWDEHILRRKDKVVVGQDVELRKQLFDMFHGGVVRDHLGVHATRHRISRLLYWKSPSTDVKRWLRECKVCQMCMYDHSASLGLLQPLPVPKCAWAAISLDFIEGLLVSKEKIPF